MEALMQSKVLGEVALSADLQSKWPVRSSTVLFEFLPTMTFDWDPQGEAKHKSSWDMVSNQFECTTRKIIS